jgi:hypothetical protein
MERFRFWSLQISQRCSSFSAKKTALRYPSQDSVEVRTLGLRGLVEN